MLLLTICVSLSASTSQAKYITIETRVNAGFEKDNLIVNVELTNRGDEPAYNLQVNTEVGTQSEVSNPLEALKVGEMFTTKSEFLISQEKPGSYPVIVRVYFTDVKRYPFSFLSLTNFTYKGPALSKIFSKIRPLEMADKGKICLKLKNLDEMEKEVNVRLIVPNEISASDPERIVNLRPMGEEELCFPVSNFSALVGANYTIYALMEYDDNAKHYSISASGSIKIVDKEKLTKAQVLIIIGTPLFILLLFCFILLFKKRKNTMRQDN